MLHAPGEIRVETVADPELVNQTDAIVRVVASCICGSDLWPYRGITKVDEPRRIGHEFVGVVEQVGRDVRTLCSGQFVIAPFVISDNACVHCRHGIHTSCVNGEGWCQTDRDGHLIDGGQGEFVRVPLGDGTLVAVEEMPDDDRIGALLTLSDVMSTGHHAALGARVEPGSTVVVVGDGAVGLCGVLAARRLGAERIIAMSRHASRQRVARSFGATDIVTTRGDEGAAEVMSLLGDVGADSVLECVGTEQSMSQAIACARPGGHVGYVGVPVSSQLPIRTLFRRNISVGGGVAPARAYIDELLVEVLDGRLDPSPVFDLTLDLEQIADGYAAMDERRAIKVMIR